jgi:hypothetical protein
MVMYWRPPPEAMRASKSLRRLFDQEGFERDDVIERAGFRHIATVEQGMDAHSGDTFKFGLHTIAFRWSMWLCTLPSENRPMKMDTSLAPSLHAGNNLLPGLALPRWRRRQSHRRPGRPLGIDLAGTDGIVANFRIAHVVIGRHADRRTMSAQADVRAGGKEPVEIGFAGGGNGTARIISASRSHP